MLDFITWLGHASFRIELTKIIYIDPWKLQSEDKADIILVSHPHYDHFSSDDILDLLKDDTVIVTVKEVAEKLAQVTNNLVVIKPGETISLMNLKITAVPAYNLDKEYHPKDKGWVGFIIEDMGYRIYYAGDTDKIKEMKDLGEINIALLPISGTYVMNPQEAAEAAALIHPAYVFPYHYGDIVGGQEEFEEFKRLVFEKDPEINILQN